MLRNCVYKNWAVSQPLTQLLAQFDVLWNKVLINSEYMHSSVTCGWFTNAVTQKFGILLMSSVRRWKWGCRILLYFCSTLRISSLACSFSRSISFWTSSILSIASCWSLSGKQNNSQSLSNINVSLLYEYYHITNVSRQTGIIYSSLLLQEYVCIVSKTSVNANYNVALRVS